MVIRGNKRRSLVVCDFLRVTKAESATRRLHRRETKQHCVASTIELHAVAPFRFDFNRSRTWPAFSAAMRYLQQQAHIKIVDVWQKNCTNTHSSTWPLKLPLGKGSSIIKYNDFARRIRLTSNFVFYQFAEIIMGEKLFYWNYFILWVKYVSTVCCEECLTNTLSFCWWITIASTAHAIVILNST